MAEATKAMAVREAAAVPKEAEVALVGRRQEYPAGREAGVAGRATAEAVGKEVPLAGTKVGVRAEMDRLGRRSSRPWVRPLGDSLSLCL